MRLSVFKSTFLAASLAFGMNAAQAGVIINPDPVLQAGIPPAINLGVFSSGRTNDSFALTGLTSSFDQFFAWSMAEAGKVVLSLNWTETGGNNTITSYAANTMYDVATSFTLQSVNVGTGVANFFTSPELIATVGSYFGHFAGTCASATCSTGLQVTAAFIPDNPSAVPAPASLGLLGLGFAGLAAFRRKKGGQATA
jgi:PEP-CTERM motif